ncbi:hypothetical protein MBEHAL_0852 [Halarchaeum acidiphilum MH1-52-1]|uniref:DUF8054 domain-containing protein n=1 Tax=Halarchaeum acidiphilum MH1-52-1 TaxID=1261545 RepID=U2YTK6_9EURY|nr:hypothetical protein [Halarchaeum acidiphilum]GAD52092.1 hypothetical protein MBEHAL_0852 [Halarchaeum acidiphilum MH1-52-1]
MGVRADFGGALSFSRVVTDPGIALERALDEAFTGYAVFVPADALLFDEGGDGLVAFGDGVPVRVRHSAGPVGDDAVTALALPGPYQVRFYEHADPPLGPDAAVDPDALAERLAGDPALAERTRERAPEAADTGPDAVTAFLDDDAGIEAIRERARAEAEARAAELGFASVDGESVDRGAPRRSDSN